MNYSTLKVRRVRRTSNLHATRYALAHHEHAVREPDSFGHVPSSSYLKSLNREADAWAAHAAATSTLKPETIRRKMNDSLAFSLRRRLNHFAVPTKLRGVRSMRSQKALSALYDLDLRFGTPLVLEAHMEALVALYGYRHVGEIAHKHKWASHLVPFGLTLHLIGVTGTERSEGYLGCNVALGHAGVAARRYAEHHEALSGGDGTGLPGMQPALSASYLSVAGNQKQVDGTCSKQAGDLSDERQQTLRTNRSDDPEDVILWRGANSRAYANVPHIVRHSPTGVEWHSTGSGAADLAYSVLAHVAGEEAAEQYAHDFKHEVIARIPYEGGYLMRGFVLDWIAEQPSRSTS